MVVGPLTMNDVNKIREILVVHGGSAALVVDPAQAERARDSVRGVYRKGFQGMSAHLYLDIADEFIPFVKDELEKMAVVFEEKPFIGGEDFLCPKCDYLSTSPGICPKHHIPLLDFSSWTQRQSTRMSRYAVAFWSFLFALLFFLVIMGPVKRLLFGNKKVLNTIDLRK